jgi:hypothetical protein
MARNLLRIIHKSIVKYTCQITTRIIDKEIVMGIVGMISPYPSVVNVEKLQYINVI